MTGVIAFPTVLILKNHSGHNELGANSQRSRPPRAVGNCSYKVQDRPRGATVAKQYNALSLMSSYILPNFGILNLKSLQEHSEAQIVLAGHRIQLDLNFAGTAIRATRMEIAKNILTHLEEHNTANLLTIRSNVNAESR